jgi:hypothetical protein
MNVEPLFIFALRADCVDSGWLHTRSAASCMNVGASYIFCVEADLFRLAEHAQRRGRA